MEEFEAPIQSDLLDISEEQLNEKFAECSQIQTSDLGRYLFLSALSILSSIFSILP